jgi:hypothetical protein
MNKIEELEEFVKSLSSSVDELTTEMIMMKREVAKLKKG